MRCFIRLSSFILLCCFMSLSMLAPNAGPVQAAAGSAVLDFKQPKPIPEDIQAIFADGLTAQEFMNLTGEVPKALESFVQAHALMIIELVDPPLAAYKKDLQNQGATPSQHDMETYRHQLEQKQATLAQELRSMDVRVQSSYTIVYNGFRARIPVKRLSEVRKMPGVKAVHPAPEHKPMLKNSVPLIGAKRVWDDLDYAGQDMVIAVIDTGIDYTHSSLGGSGDPDDYATNDPDLVEPSSFPTAKVIAGYDFAGTEYDAGCTSDQEAAGLCTSTPLPDPDPLDENSHGTHVASIAAGVSSGKVSPGVAPEAKLMALKVFGESGSTNLTMDALEWAADNYQDHGTPHVINMSLGSPFGTGSGPDITAANNAADLGMVVVASAGNSGNVSYITGSPGTGTKVISVASSTTGGITGPTVTTDGLDPMIYQPNGFDNNTGQFEDPVVAPLGYAGNLSGAADDKLCDISGLGSNALNGKLALIQRGGCTFSTKVNNAHALGALGALIFNNSSDDRLTMAGDPVHIPAGFLAQSDGQLLITKDSQQTTVSSQDDVTTIPDPYTPADEIAEFSSRGPRGVDSFLKPEVTAPGVNIFAANMGSGTDGISMSGTSMAAPHVAGAAALIKQANPAWSPEDVKAALMNTSVDLADSTPIPRSGSGRIDAFRSVSTETLCIGDQDLVGLSWGLIPGSTDNLVLQKTVQVFNLSTGQQSFDNGWAFQPGALTAGAQISVQPAQVDIAPGSSADITATLTLDLTSILTAFSQVLEEYYGFITLSPNLGSSQGGSSPSLQLPVAFLPRPFAQLEVNMQERIADPASDVARFTAAHSGPTPSHLWVYPALIHNLHNSQSMSGPGDVRLFGMNFAGWVDASYGDMLEVAINTWDAWHVPQHYFAEFDLHLDIDQDGSFDYIDFNFNYGRITGSGDDNQWVALQLDLSDGMIYLASPYYLNTDFNSSYMEWYLPTTWQDLNRTNSDFDYQLISHEQVYQGSNKMTMPPGSFDYMQPPFDWSLTSFYPDSDDPNVQGQIEVDSLEGYLLSNPKGAFLVDTQGDPRNQKGSQAYFLNIKPIVLPGIIMLLME